MDTDTDTDFYFLNEEVTIKKPWGENSVCAD